MANEKPDRIISSFQKPLRSLVRSVRRLILSARSSGTLRFGSDVVFGKGCVFLSPVYAHFGNNIRVGAYCHCEANLIVGDDTLISSYVSFIGNDHAFDGDSRSIFFQSRNPPANIVLEGDNLIGFGATIVGNVRIGKGCVVGARAVVTKDLPANTVCVGIPARPVRKRLRS